jgi:predicted RNA binding protein YcfA (HicA-like mRNA interferase family)
MPKVREVIKRLEDAGWRQVRMRGDHRQYRHPNSPWVISVAGHPNEQVPDGTWNDIRKKAGWK